MIDVVVSERGLLNMNLLVGEVLDAGKLTAPDGTPLAFRIAGVFEAADPLRSLLGGLARGLRQHGPDERGAVPRAVCGLWDGSGRT